ncbi:hypothetical protein [Paracoccus seriniphilus]|uniref:Uncharacterized protein n=1 Tax=Paracoccus seriniphilus TaxID=184748 RepID=A0A239Q1U8_9RHOB|nr:hypothetical protein [Paracoccus seriniphilus]WCR14535.1 hypothetical protein JHW44_03510 [Paracoccus seriniphilus]SNT76569.1 hypothetical protein SAMN05444959_12211 [Paracoccus seriniphilus]
MIALFRLIVLVFLLEAMFYLLLRIYIRSLRRERLEEIWDERHPDKAGDSAARDEFLRKSMVGFDRTLKSRLLWLVFILPTMAIMGIVYWVNWQ